MIGRMWPHDKHAVTGFRVGDQRTTVGTVLFFPVFIHLQTSVFFLGNTISMSLCWTHKILAENPDLSIKKEQTVKPTVTKMNYMMQL